MSTFKENTLKEMEAAHERAIRNTTKEEYWKMRKRLKELEEASYKAHDKYYGNNDDGLLVEADELEAELENAYKRHRKYREYVLEVEESLLDRGILLKRHTKKEEK